MRLANVIAVARSEVRLTRRLVRYWVFLALAFIFLVLAFLYYGLVHGFFSSYSATVAAIGPRFLIAGFGNIYILVFMLGLVFLGFDLRARDERERMAEVLDSRPFTNLELVTGRFVGLFLMAWVPLVITSLLLQGLGALLRALGSPVGEPMAPTSLLQLTFFMGIPALVHTLGLIFFITLVARNRLLAAVLVILVLAGGFAGGLFLPLYHVPWLDVTGAYDGYVRLLPSEILSDVADASGWLQRLAVLLTGIGLLGLSAAVHPRLDGGARRNTAAAGGALLLLGVVILGLVVNDRVGTMHQLEAWRTAHEARLGEAEPDLQSITADLRVVPGRKMELELEMGLRAPAEEGLSSALFTLNPGLVVHEVKDASGASLQFSHDDGLLEVQFGSRLAPGTETALSMRISGRPDLRFGFLDGARTAEEIQGLDGNLILLGMERAVFHPRFVALMPGIRWLPAPGADVARDDPRRRHADYFSIDLTVHVPEGWLAVGPGRRHEAASDPGGASFRFSPGADVPEVAVIASRFEARSAEIEGVHMEVLVHPEHALNLEVLADAGGDIRSWLGDQLREAAEDGLPYPYDGFSLVEVPNTLRSYGGGWRLDTVLAQPGMVLMREMSFPTARFDVPFDDPDDFKDREGGVARAKFERVRNYFRNDFTGGNALIGGSRNFFVYQTSAAGDEALALNFVLDDLATHVITDTRGYFSAHMFSRDLNQQLIQQAIFNYLTSGNRNGDVASAVIDTLTSRAEVWNSVMESALTDIDPAENPQRTIDILTLKAGALAKSVYDELGRDKATLLLAELRREHAGATFTLDDVVRAGETIDPELGPLFEDWMTTTNLPGFVGEHAETVRLEDAEDGSPRYQLTATVRNDEPVPGVFRFVYAVGQDEDRQQVESDPVRIGGPETVRYGLVLSQPPDSVFVQPYLSLNRESFRIPMDPVDEEKIVRAEPFEGVEHLEWQKPQDDSIVVDDLDDGFEAVDDTSSGGVRLGSRGVGRLTDQGLPVQNFGRPPSRWSRAISSTAWGTYRHTFAYVRPGKGKKQARFSTEIPAAGSWELEIHLPHKQRFRRLEDWGTWKLEVIDGSGSTAVDFDATAAPRGWNLAGSFELADGEVTVVFSDATEGEIVITDAIRWTPSVGSSTTAEAQP